jgi:hypothetical protein
MELAPDTDVVMGDSSMGPGAPPTSAVVPSLPTPDVARSFPPPSASEAARQPSTAGSEAGDIIIRTGDREESLSCALNAGFNELGEGGRANEEVVMDVDGEGLSEVGTLRLGNIGDEVDSREASVGAGGASAP